MRLAAIIRFYINGFRRMTLGRALWGIILLKLVVIFVILRVFFFTPALQGSDAEKGEQVSTELTRRAASLPLLPHYGRP